MAEPAATATIAKAKQNGKTLKIVASLQDLYQKQSGSKKTGYHQHQWRLGQRGRHMGDAVRHSTSSFVC